MPFVLAEAATGVVSFLTGHLSIPPLLGAGSAVDLSILIAGLLVFVYRVRNGLRLRSELRRERPSPRPRAEGTLASSIANPAKRGHETLGFVPAGGFRGGARPGANLFLPLFVPEQEGDEDRRREEAPPNRLV